MIRLPTADPDDEKVIRSFSRYEGGGTPGFVTDFLGVRTRLSYFAGIDHYSGLVESYPVPCNFHANAIEWAGVLRSVAEAEGPGFVALELGAGWGPWLVTAGVAARLKGLADVRLVGVEGSCKHLEFLRSHFRDNGFDPADHQLLQGIVGPYNGTAHFPIIAEGDANWGAEATFQVRLAVAPSAPTRSLVRRIGRPMLRVLRNMKARLRDQGAAQATTVRTEKLPCYSLRTLLEPYPAADVVHIDIQGAEHDVVAASRGVLEAKVRRLVIGTHGRLIEERLLNELAGRGWRLESEEPCVFEQRGEHVYLHRDGCQVWNNPRLAAGRLRCAA
jgi:hypothetical protein